MFWVFYILALLINMFVIRTAWNSMNYGEKKELLAVAVIILIVNLIPYINVVLLIVLTIIFVIIMFDKNGVNIIDKILFIKK